LTANLRVCTRMIVPLTRPASEFQLTRSWILKVFGTIVRSDAAKEPQRRQVLALGERHEHPTGTPAFRFHEIAVFLAIRAFGSGTGRLDQWKRRRSRGFAAWSDDTNTFFTIGHSTRPMVEFVDLLRESDVRLVIDVRSIPRSRTNPQFNQATLAETLSPLQIGYEHISELGGRRGKSRAAESSPNNYWRVRSFRNYADYALTAPFATGLTRLRERGAEQRCVVMCAEAVWWRCHRRIANCFARLGRRHTGDGVFR
jgi:uncharacterized protein DUF488